MDVREFISSGVLELYAMGALSDAERKEVEQVCASHKEAAEELKRVEDALNTYAEANAIHPRPAVKSELMEKISSGNGRIVRFGGPHELTYKYLIAACIASLIISTFASVFFYQKWSE